MAQYEAILLLNPELDEGGVTKIKCRIEEVITGAKGELKSWEGWGRRRLATKIKSKVEATYILFTLEGTGKIVDELRKAFGLSEDVLRCMFLRKDAKG